MTVTLTPELERWIEEQLELGLYRDKSEVVQHALERLAKEDRRAALQTEIDKGLQDIEAGRVVKFTPQLVEDIKRRGRARRS